MNGLGYTGVTNGTRKRFDLTSTDESQSMETKPTNYQKQKNCQLQRLNDVMMLVIFIIIIIFSPWAASLLMSSFSYLFCYVSAC